MRIYEHINEYVDDSSQIILILLTVPAHKPIKPIYIKMFIELIDGLGEKNE